MSNIAENLRKILNARYGKDVRQAIHDSIHDCYEDGKAGSTDLIARDEIIDLNAQIATLVSELGNKANVDHTHDNRYYTESEVDNLLLGKTGTLGVTRLVSEQQSISPTGKSTFNFDLKTIPNIKPLALVGYNVSSSACFIYRMQMNYTNNTVAIGVHSTSESTVTAAATIDILYEAITDTVPAMVATFSMDENDI